MGLGYVQVILYVEPAAPISHPLNLYSTLSQLAVPSVKE
jgi:hypothetical protein